jgi:ABC-type sugar transport system permease subunit
VTGPGRQRRRGLAYLFVAPAAGLTVAFSLVPLGMLAYRSLFRGGVFATTLRFTGLGNYTAMLANGGGHALAVTAAYTAGFVLLTMAAALVAVVPVLAVAVAAQRHIIEGITLGALG